MMETAGWTPTLNARITNLTSTSTAAGLEEITLQLSVPVSAELDPNLECQDYELDFDINRGWFGGDYLAIVGACECRTGQWDDRQLQCQVFAG